MGGFLGVVSYGLGTVVGFLIIGTLLVWFVQDVTQKKHTILRNYPIIGHFRYWFEQFG